MKKELVGSAIIKRTRSSKRSSTSQSNKSKVTNKFRNAVKKVIVFQTFFRQKRKFYELPVSNVGLPQRYVKKRSFFEDSKPKFNNVFAVNPKMRVILTTRPDFRNRCDIVKTVNYLRACGAKVCLLGEYTKREEEITLARYVHYSRYEENRVLALKGRKASFLYYVISGVIAIVDELDVGNDKVVANSSKVIKKGYCSNINEIMQASKRETSLVCLREVEVLSISRQDYMKIRKASSQSVVEYFKQNRTLSIFPFDKLKNNVHHFQNKYYAKDEVINGRSQKFENIYIVKTGIISLLKKHQCDKDSNFKIKNFSRKEDFKTQQINYRKLTESTFIVNQPLQMKLKALEIHAVKKENLINLKSVNTETDEATGEDQITEKAEEINFFTHLKNARISDEELAREVAASDKRKFWKERSATLYDAVDGEQNIIDVTDFQPSETEDEKIMAAKNIPSVVMKIGQLETGDVYGVDYLNNQDSNDTIMKSCGCEVIEVNRNFFLRHAPAVLLARLNFKEKDVPKKVDVKLSYETSEKWKMFQSLSVHR